MTVALGVIMARGRVKCDPVSLDKTRRHSSRDSRETQKRLRRYTGTTYERLLGETEETYV